MPLKKSTGNMYDWVTHMHSHLGGECPHKCSYCYVQKNRFGVAERYQGAPRLIEKELLVNYGSGKTIFIEHMNDLFAEGIKREWIEAILNHCKKYPDNTYVFQSKAISYAFMQYANDIPKNSLIGTTIETDKAIPETISKAPDALSRIRGIDFFKSMGFKTFITLEPIMDFTSELFGWLIDSKPDFINIGADSKENKLSEPPYFKVHALIDGLQKAGLIIKQKSNLGRLLK